MSGSEGPRRAATGAEPAGFLAAAGLRVEAQHGDWDRNPTGPEIVTVASA